MPELVLGPLLRYAGATEATVWVETDGSCEVEVLGCTSSTFRVGEHHYAIVHVTGLDEICEYEVRLDGEKVWPEAGSPFPPGVIRPLKNGETLKLVFGSCRISAPHEPPYILAHDEDERGLGVDALYATAMELRDMPSEDLPHALVLLGDQIYAHKPPFDTLQFLNERRNTADPPGEAVADFEEYARIYRDAWSDGTRWSYHRDLGNTRLLMIDSRGGRVLDEGHRSMVDAEEWAWISDKATGDFDHLLFGTSLPLLLGPAMHHLQTWDERLCSGAWGERAARWAEGFRRSQDLDRWASFHDSFAAMVGLIQEIASGERGDSPSTISILSGDVHHGYLAKATLENDAKSRLHQLVCSPLRNALPNKKSYLQGHAWAKPAIHATRLLARLSGVTREPLAWRLTHEATFFDNQVATLELEGRSATVTFEKASLDASKEPTLERLYGCRLA